MRWIQKTSEPHQLTEWRSRNNTDLNFGYDLLRKDPKVVIALVDILLKEQGCICAYTGMRIGMEITNQEKYKAEYFCHLEHLSPQEHCSSDDSVSYTNLVACYPPPNQDRKFPYGAHKKDDWPDCEEQSRLFISPLDKTSESRFRFDLKGEIKPTETEDIAAKTTIEKLGLNNEELIDLRKGAIQGTLGKTNDVPLKRIKQRLKSLQAQRGGQLDPFWFVLKQVLEKRIVKLEDIAKRKALQKNKGKGKPKRSKK